MIVYGISETSVQLSWDHCYKIGKQNFLISLAPKEDKQLRQTNKQNYNMKDSNSDKDNKKNSEGKNRKGSNSNIILHNILAFNNIGSQDYLLY
jgi:hypothetical protein